MAIVPLQSEPSAAISTADGSVSVRIKTRARTFTRFVLVLFFLGWFLGGIANFVDMQKDQHGGSFDAALPMFIGWTTGGVAVLFMISWNFFGGEIVELDARQLIHRREIFGRGFTREFDANHVKDFRISSGTGLYGGGLDHWGCGPGTVSFDYGLKTYRFGSTLEEAEARHVITALQSHLSKKRTLA